jgi:hypothetical protein
VSFLDLDRLSPADLVAQYVLECRGQGLFLPYTDHAVIGEWLAAAGDPDELLLILADVLPTFYAKAAAKGRRPGSLAGVRRLVLSRVRDRVMRQPQVEG